MNMGVHGCALAERRRKVPTSALGVPIRKAVKLGASFSSNNHTTYYNDELNAHESKRHTDVINKYASTNDFYFDKQGKTTPESRAFVLSGVPGSQFRQDQVQQQDSPWQGSQVSLALLLCVNIM